MLRCADPVLALVAPLLSPLCGLSGMALLWCYGVVVCYSLSCTSPQAESADDVAQFRGPKRPCTRECVLIINTETGEAILEKISSSVNLKSVRYKYTTCAYMYMYLYLYM